MLGVLSQASVANFDVTKLVFDDSEWVLDFGPDFGFHLLELLLHGRYRLLRIQGLALAALHGDMPLEFALGCWLWHVGAFVCTLIASIGVSIDFLPMQQTVSFNDIVDVGRCAPHGVHQARIRIHADMCLHTKVPLVAWPVGAAFYAKFHAAQSQPKPNVRGTKRCQDVDHLVQRYHG